MKITTIGIDLAKSVFQIHGVNEHGKAVVKKQLKRALMAEFFTNLPPCLIGMVACGGAHHWARKLQEFGHTVKLMAPTMSFVPIKTVEQQAILSVHRAREGSVSLRRKGHCSR